MAKYLVLGSAVGLRMAGIAAAFALAVAGLGAPTLASAEDDEAEFAALLPGEGLVDDELSEVHGKGLSVSSTGSAAMDSALVGQILVDAKIQRLVDDALRRSTARLPTVRVRGPRPDSSLMSEVAASSSSNN